MLLLLLLWLLLLLLLWNALLLPRETARPVRSRTEPRPLFLSSETILFCLLGILSSLNPELFPWPARVAILYSTLLCSTLLYSTLPYSTLLYSAILYYNML